MKKMLFISVVILIFAGVSVAQKGTAEPDYYPMNYAGETFTGEVTSVNEDTREFTLTLKEKEKEKTFVGVLPKGYKTKMKDGSESEVKLADMMGMRVKAYYTTKTRKVNDQKVKVNDVFRIKFLPPAK